METGKHWRSFEDEKFLGSWEFALNETKTFTIKSIGMEKVTGSNGRTDDLMVVHFTEGKPMILNKTNKKAIEASLKTGIIDKWIGHTISVSVKKVKFGSGMVDGMRVSTTAKSQSAPVPVVLPTLKKDSPEWNNMVIYLQDDKNKAVDFDELFSKIEKKYKVTSILKKQLKSKHEE